MARLVLFLVSCLLGQAFCVPAGSRRQGNRRPLRESSDVTDDSTKIVETEVSDSQSTSSTTNSYDLDDDDDDDDFGDSMQTSPSTGGGSNLMSLLNLANALFPSASAGNLQSMIRRVIREYFVRNPLLLRRQDVADNVIEIDYVNELTPPFQRQEDENGDTHESNESNHSNGEDSSGSEENDNAAEESVEDNTSDKAAKQDSGLNDNKDVDDSDYSDEPPGGGDGQGGGVLGFLAGLSGGEDGQSDLGSLLAAVSMIVGNLSGDGFELNSLIATALGLFIGLLKNNGAFFGNFLSKLIKGTSAVSDESGSSEDDGNKMQMSDSTGFFGSSSGTPESPLWTLKMAVLRAFLQFGVSVLGMASSSLTGAVTV